MGYLQACHHGLKHGVFLALLCLHLKACNLNLNLNIFRPSEEPEAPGLAWTSGAGEHSGTELVEEG